MEIKFNTLPTVFKCPLLPSVPWRLTRSEYKCTCIRKTSNIFTHQSRISSRFAGYVQTDNKS
ncbi:hypothetical protein C0J52_01678 [Blattella germanica]|nr:hypothetical protein C0J52_01678 [Blattella germanica]